MAKDLLDFIDFSNLECLNENPGHVAANALKQGYREDDGLYLESDTGRCKPGNDTTLLRCKIVHDITPGFQLHNIFRRSPGQLLVKTAAGCGR